MPQETSHDEVIRLRAAFAALRAQVERDSRRRTPRPLLPALLAALLVALIPLAALAANPFVDLNPGSPHNGNIQAIADAGITTGCDPGVAYCPKDKVTREEMASFLARTAGLGGNSPVANALTAQSAAHSTVADSATTVQGRQPGEFLRAAGASSDKNSELNAAAPAYATALDVTIAVPGPGYVLVSGTLTVGATDLACAVAQPCVVRARLRDAAPGGLATPALPVYVAANGAKEGSAAPTFLFPVSQAGAHRYILELAGNGTSAGKTDFTAPVLTALYIPFGAAGQVP